MTDDIRSRIARILAVAYVAAGSVSCTVGPDYVRPSVAVPAAYKEAAAAKAAETVRELPRGRWWEIFRDADLDALEAQVDVDNQTLRAAEARVRQAQALVEIARAPSVLTLNAGGSNQKLGLAAGWELDLWGRIRRNVEAATATAESSADELAAARLSLQAQVAQNYFLLRVQDAEIRRCRRTSRGTNARCSSRATSMPSASRPAATSCRRKRSSIRPGPRSSRRPWTGHNSSMPSPSWSASHPPTSTSPPLP